METIKKRGRPKKEKESEDRSWKHGECIWCGAIYEKRMRSQQFCERGCRDQYYFNLKETRELARFTIFTRDEFRCVYCGKSSIEDSVALVVDHVIPYCEGGDSGCYNLVTACFECNKMKGPYLLEESVYLRIVERNKRLNGGISKAKQVFVEKVIQKLKESYSKNYEKEG